MTWTEAVAYIEDQTWSATRLGLDRTRALLRRMGDPQKGLKFVHITGSNGKGSTSAMVAQVLQRAGYRTGLYVSPHLQEFRERMRVNGEMIPKRDLARITQRARAAAEELEDHPSQFELSTAIALTWFARVGCDIVVLEVGMGGALDSTNVIDAPEVAVFTNIGLEHTEYLGKTIREIARTKAGIVKPGCDAVCYDGDPRATAVVEEVCRDLGAPFHRVDFSRLTPVGQDLTGQRFLWEGRERKLPLLGAHQLRNAATALTALETLRRRGWTIPEEAVSQGLETVTWPARLEVLRQTPLFLLDGGHNPQCAQALAEFLDQTLAGDRVTLLLGVLADKDWTAMLALLAPYAQRVLCVTPPSPRALPGEALGEGAARLGLGVQVCSSPRAGAMAALRAGWPTVAFGSLYMAGEIRAAVLDGPGNRLGKNA